MVQGGANVWTNFSYGHLDEYPCGWLLSPDCSRLILFTKNKKSSKNNLKILAYTYHASNSGEPASIKSSSQMFLEDAWNKWHHLQSEGWTLEKLELPE